MPPPLAEKHRLRRVKDGELIASIFDDLRGQNIDSPTRKKQLLCNYLVLFEVSMWENYIEDLVDEAQEFLLNHIDNPIEIGYDVLIPISDELMHCKDKRAIWKIANSSWKQELRQSRKKLIESFHTPNPDNTDALVFRTLGLKHISNCWRWQKMIPAKAKERLAKLIKLRGGIAHGSLDAPKLNYPTFINRLMFTVRLCHYSADAIADHVQSLTGQLPWNFQEK
jgi:RiboL-PSP-HEPN